MQCLWLISKVCALKVTKVCFPPPFSTGWWTQKTTYYKPGRRRAGHSSGRWWPPSSSTGCCRRGRWQPGRRRSSWDGGFLNMASSSMVRKTESYCSQCKQPAGWKCSLMCWINLNSIRQHLHHWLSELKWLHFKIDWPFSLLWPALTGGPHSLTGGHAMDRLMICEWLLVTLKPAAPVNSHDSPLHDPLDDLSCYIMVTWL